MKNKNEKEIARLNALFKEIGAPETFIPLPLRDAREFSSPENPRAQFEFSDACQKLIYPSESVARKVALSRERKGAQKLRVYKCEECHGFHLSSYISKT